MDQDQSNVMNGFPQRDRPSANLPAAVFLAAKRYQLGLPLKKYQDEDPIGIRNWWKRVRMVAVIIGVGLLLEVVTDSRLLTSPNILPVILLMFLGVMSPLVIIVLVATIRINDHMKKREYLCTDGFLIMTESDAVLAAVHWNEIQTIYCKMGFIKDDLVKQFSVLTKDNQRVKVSIRVCRLGTYGTQELGEQIIEELERLDLPVSIKRSYAYQPDE